MFVAKTDCTSATNQLVAFSFFLSPRKNIFSPFHLTGLYLLYLCCKFPISKSWVQMHPACGIEGGHV